MKSPRRLPTLSLREEFEDEGDEDEANPFYLGSTGKTPRPLFILVLQAKHQDRQIQWSKR
jgi:hypothetical protein